MPKARVIPTLLTDGVSLVKGKSFQSWRTVGVAVAAAQVFSLRDVDELVLLDVSATREQRTIDPRVVGAVAECLSIPLAVGGGITSLQDVEVLLRSGADKVVIGSALTTKPGFVSDAAAHFGSQAIVGSVDATDDSGASISTRSGAKKESISVLAAARRFEELGAGEILLQSVARDGLLSGMDLDTIARVCEIATIPVIASGGAADYDDLYAALRAGASAVAAGAMFQFTQQTPRGAREHLAARGIAVRNA